LILKKIAGEGFEPTDFGVMKAPRFANAMVRVFTNQLIEERNLPGVFFVK
jgi:hypothetical protein